MGMVPFVTQTYQHRAEDVSACRTVNFYVEQVPAEVGKEQTVLISTPGINLFSDVGSHISHIVRGLYYTSTSETIAAVGTGLFQIFADGSSSKIMDIAAGASKVSMVDNGWHLVVVDGASMWAIELEDKSNIVAVNCQTQTPQKVEYLGKRIVLIDGTKDYRWSDIGDATSWAALDVDEADSFADPIQSIAVVRNELWLFGPRSYEVRRLTTDANYPYSLIQGSSGEIGCGAPESVASIGESVFFLGSSAAGQDIVYMSNGYSVQPISNPAISYLLSSAGNTADATGWTYQMEQHVFYVLTLEMGDRTVVYDVSNGTWCERASRDPNYNLLHKWSPKYATYSNSGILLGSSEGPYILQLSLDTYDEFWTRAVPGTQADPSDLSTQTIIPIQRIHQSPHYWDSMGTVSVDEFTLDIMAGTGLQNGQGQDPQVMLQISKDGGHTFGSERWKSFGSIGKYAQRVAWRLLGRARSMVIRLTITDPVKVIISGGRLVSSSMGDKAR